MTRLYAVVLAACVGSLGSACSAEVAPSVVVASPQPPPPIEGADAWEPFELYTHCGIDRSRIEYDGDYWEAIGPGPLSDGSGNPPAGFGNPSDEGWIARTGADAAAYQSSRGVPLFLRRLEEQPDLGACM